jgi:hypothetical protein
MSRSSSGKRFPKFVTLREGDDGHALAPVFFEHPETFKPTVGHGLDAWHRCFTWGTEDEEWESRNSGHVNAIMQMMSMFDHFNSPGPQRQFIDALVAKKKRLIDAAKLTAEPFYARDFVIDIDVFDNSVKREVPNVQVPPTAEELALAARSNPRCFRTVRVSGGITLRALHDKVLAPVFGFARNYHGYIFTDLKDGSCFGAENSGAIDMMHLQTHGIHTYISDRDVKLGDILQSEGAQMGWLYDLGDRYEFILTAKEIKMKEESTGKVEVLDGAFASPPEDSAGCKGSGTFGYMKFLSEITRCKRGSSEWKALCRQIDQASPLNYQGKRYDPDDFTVQKSQQDVLEAFRSPASRPEGATKFVSSLGGSGLTPASGSGLTSIPGFMPSPGSKLTVAEDPRSAADEFSGIRRGFFTRVETVSDGRLPMSH